MKIGSNGILAQWASDNPDNGTKAQKSVGRSRRKSLRRGSQELGFSMSSVRRILVKDLEFYPYRMQIKHQLTETDMEEKLTMCQGLALKKVLGDFH